MCIRDRDNTISFKPYGKFDDQSQIILYFKIDKSGNIYVSNDEVTIPVSYTHLRAHETVLDLVCRLLLEKKKKQNKNTTKKIKKI